MVKVALVTPLKDEKDSIKKLIRSISNQSIRINHWIIIENDSTDGSKELMSEIKKVNNVDNFCVLNLEFANKKYDLGIKYSTIVNSGFDFIKNEIGIDKLDYIGILDADCFPKYNYYEKLVDFMSNNKKVGIAGGRIHFENGKEHFINENHVRGSGRLWKVECFNDAGYIIGMSADTLSATKAKLRGWEVTVVSDAVIYSREAGVKVGNSYYGKASYYRGDRILYVLLRSLKNIIFFRFNFGIQFLYGYFSSLLKKERRIEDAELFHFYNNRKLRDMI